MKSFRELFCEERSCSAEQFSRKVFWQCLHRHAAFVAPILGGFRSEYFSIDRELIEGAGRAIRMSQVRQEVRDYFSNSRNRGWLRRRANVRLSAKRLMPLASKYLPGADILPPFDGALLR